MESVWFGTLLKDGFEDQGTNQQPSGQELNT